VAARDRAGVASLAPIRPSVSADHPAAGADHTGAERGNRDGFRVGINVEHDDARAGGAIEEPQHCLNRTLAGPRIEG